MSIMIAAYVDLCECGEHGHFVLSGGRTSREFCSRPVARRELLELEACGDITKEEVLFLTDYVARVAQLPVVEREAGFLARLTCDVLNDERTSEQALEESPSKYVN